MLKPPDWLTDLEIRTGTVPTQLAKVDAQGVLWQAGDGNFLLAIPGVARYLVCAGRRITIDPVPGTPEKQIAHFLYMTPIAALLYQRGFLALHAAVLAGDGGAILIAGDLGAGKSSLLVAGASKGWEMLADELAAVSFDDRRRLSFYPMIPGEQEIRLWRSAAEKLLPQDAEYQGSDSSANDSQLTYRANWELNTDGEEVYLPWISQMIREPQSLQAIFWLSVVNTEEIEIERIVGAEAFRTVGVMAYNSQIADALFDRAVYLRLAAAVANSVPIYHIQRPRGRWTVEKLIERIMNTQ